MQLPGIDRRDYLPLLHRVAWLLLFLAAPTASFGSTFHVDCSAARSGSGTGSSPWNSLAAASAHTFHPGDHLLFRSGSVCQGKLVLHGSGRAGAPVTVSRYGPGAPPVLDGNGLPGSVVLLRNAEQWEIADLQLRNRGSAPATRSGLLAENASGRTLHHLWLHHLVIDTVQGWPGGWYSSNAGIGVQTDHTPAPSAWDDVRIENNTLRHVDRIAIAVTPDHDGIGTGLTTRLIIRNNHIEDSGGDDILVVKGSGTVLAGNDATLGGSRSVHGCPPAGMYCNKASASMWIAGSENTIMRGNRVSCYQNEADGQAFDVDWGNRNTLIESNLSQNNRGGFLLLMPAFRLRGEPTALRPSSGTVVRYNVSQNDTLSAGCARQPNASGPASVFHLVGDVPNQPGAAGPVPLIYNNTILLSPAATADVIGSRKGTRVRGSLIFANNIVVNHGRGGYVETEHSVFRRNLFFGAALTPAGAIESINADPLFAGPFTGAGLAMDSNALRLLPQSPARDASVSIDLLTSVIDEQTRSEARDLGAPVALADTPLQNQQLSRPQSADAPGR